MKLPAMTILAAGMLLLGLVPNASAHGYSAAGLGVRDDQAFRVFMSRAANVANGTAPYGITITDAALNLVAQALFWAVDNFVGDEDIPGPTYTNTNFTADSVTPGVDFQLRGAQVNLFVTARGHFGEFEIVVGPALFL